MLPASKAVTVTLIGVPAVATDGALTRKVAASPGETGRGADVPDIVGSTVSVAVTV